MQQPDGVAIGLGDEDAMIRSAQDCVPAFGQLGRADGIAKLIEQRGQGGEVVPRNFSGHPGDRNHRTIHDSSGFPHRIPARRAGVAFL
jgi:hypothetical protein